MKPIKMSMVFGFIATVLIISQVSAACDYISASQGMKLKYKGDYSYTQVGGSEDIEDKIGFSVLVDVVSVTEINSTACNIIYTMNTSVDKYHISEMFQSIGNNSQNISSDTSAALEFGKFFVNKNVENKELNQTAGNNYNYSTWNDDGILKSLKMKIFSVNGSINTTIELSLSLVKDEVPGYDMVIIVGVTTLALIVMVYMRKKKIIYKR
ncbi:MAG: hypothetical protein ACTSVI_07485 [Promethearchaeota archaeon]